MVSGKGGTGKTSIVASLAALARGRAVYADCDVDAPDLHLILQPEIKERREFFGIKRAIIDRLEMHPVRLMPGCLSVRGHLRFSG